MLQIAQGRVESHLVPSIVPAGLPSKTAPPYTLPRDPDHLLLPGSHRPIARTMPRQRTRLADVVQRLQPKENRVRNRAHARDACPRLELQTIWGPRQRRWEREDPLVCGERVGRRGGERDQRALVLVRGVDRRLVLRSEHLYVKRAGAVP